MKKSRAGRHLGNDAQHASPGAAASGEEAAGPDLAVIQAEHYADQVTADIAHKPFIHPRGIVTTGTALASGKRAVRFFVSYAHADSPHFEALVKELKVRLDTSSRYEFTLWTDRDIQPGEDWQESIHKALDACDCGLLLLSPAFLASTFIGKHELPRFVGEPDNCTIKPVIPVGLVPVSFERQDLKGLEKHQLFLHRTVRHDGRFFDELQGRPQKRAFAQKLYEGIEKRLDVYKAPDQAARNERDLAGDCKSVRQPRM